MHVAVFGASGRTGRLIVDALLERGHTVNAFVRDPQRLTRRDPALSVTVGTAGDAEAIARAVSNVACVISAAASGHGVLTSLAGHLVPVLASKGPDRVVTLAGAATELPGDPRVFKRRFFLKMMSLGGMEIMDDVRAHWAALQAAKLNGTLVRPPRLTDGPATGRLKHGGNLVLGMMDSISRADLAAFMVDIALDGRYVREAPFVARA